MIVLFEIGDGICKGVGTPTNRDRKFIENLASAFIVDVRGAGRGKLEMSLILTVRLRARLIRKRSIDFSPSHAANISAFINRFRNGFILF